MIGFNALGKLGRLGNQMFQFSALKGIARKNGYQFCIPPSQNTDEWKDHQLFGSFKMDGVNELNIQYVDNDRPVVFEDKFYFNEKIFNECPDWVSIHGFFQTEKYFKHIRDELIQDFQFIDEVQKSCNDMMRQLEEPPIALHIRRTDYITNPNHNSLNLSYYKEALTRFDDDAIVLVFSDDPEWCHEQHIFSGDRFMIADGNTNTVDMCLMTMCSGHIIANSSFSWWGAWLSNSKKVISPSDWFTGSNNERLNTKDIYCDGWEII